MYLRTPKRYTRGQKRSPISLRWLWLWILTPLVVLAGVEIYNRRDALGPPVHQAIYGVLDSAQQSLATAGAPPPPPTPDPRGQLERAEADWNEGRVEAALNTYESILDAVPNDLQSHYRVTLGLAMEGDLEAALEAAERTITADPLASDAWAIRAMVLDWSGRYGEAIASALRAVELSGENARALAFLAEAYHDLGQSDLALETVERALEINPDSFEALRVRGLLAWEFEFDFDGARSYFEQAYALAPNLAYLAIDLARINFLAFQEPEEAIGYLREVVEANPRNTTALFEMGRVYYTGLGDPSQALDYLTRCVEVNPDNILCQGLLGRVQMALDNYTLAAEALGRAIDLGTGSPRHYLWAGRTQIALGNCPAAVPLLEQSVRLGTETGDTEAVTAAQADLSECSVVLPGLEITPEATPEGT
ncbi:MAG: tetratricopeptide repeat protein [Chloroflexi bacterium]|nr:tetratricopeptide repeat protein [Chloroflexota bacterium]